ncbi:LysR family transcriptional regulator [Variovorax sp. J22G21]|uniref:LysR family transcriptional regulator n=1 Tax=Variovorax fucosicus TaxID=3053517 RepID=UPI0025781D95|nr:MULTISPECIES: LysR family transcriptional regulator [unclassified Variovorax]MDM0037930.1 LysR family transcriptional regulator [Variovorax sp. J22R193]MDM0056397.1 LysR family transcriptional regulator [Variovorax sp. J22G47]MDM0062706.1 LysR family transcriptional regulator [Variovorax sp. J22G21]
MDRLLAMEMFVRVVETGSFSKAAREFNTTQPTVTKQIAAAEARLKVRLLNRNTRGVSLTESGALYYEKCKTIVRDAGEADSIVQLKQGQAQGLLRIGTSVAFGRRVVVPLALEYMRRHPQVQLDLSFEDRYVDLIAQGIDVAIRMGKLADSSLGARFLGMNPWVMVASPAYLKKHGVPKRAQDLSAHVALIYSSVVGDEVWRMRTPKGEAVNVAVSGRFRSNNVSAVLAAARDGLGIAMMPRYVASDSLLLGKVLEVLADHTLAEQEIHAVFPSPKLVPGKVSAFVAFLQGRFAEGWWQAPSGK